MQVTSYEIYKNNYSRIGNSTREIKLDCCCRYSGFCSVHLKLNVFHGVFVFINFVFFPSICIFSHLIKRANRIVVFFFIVYFGTTNSQQMKQVFITHMYVNKIQ